MVYVDRLRPVPLTAEWRWESSCHMIADTLEELHAMAHKVDLLPNWFQDGRHPHYDLARHKREQAIRAGAKVISTREMIQRLKGLG